LVVDIRLSVSGSDWATKYSNGDGLADCIRKSSLIFTRAGSIAYCCDVFVSCDVRAGPFQIFEVAPGGSLSFMRNGGMGAASRVVHPEWWGAAPSADGATNSAAIRAAIGSIYEEGIVEFQEGVYDLDGPLELTGNATVHLIGKGPDSTFLRQIGAGDSPLIRITNSSTVLDLGLIGCGNFPSSASTNYSRKEMRCAAILFSTRNAGPRFRNLSIEGCKIGICLHSPGLDINKPAPDTPSDEPTCMNRMILERIHIHHVDWGIVFDCGANGNCLSDLRVHDARIGVLFPVPRYLDDETLYQPPSMTTFDGCSFEDVSVGVHFVSPVAAPYFDHGRFARCDIAAILFEPDTIHVQPASVGRCTFEGCTRDVVATTAEGLNPLPWLSIAGPEGTSSCLPCLPFGRPGDRIYNRMESVSEGEPVGWIHLPPKKIPVEARDTLYAGKVELEAPPADRSPASALASTAAGKRKA
jgi:hypothetical protein